VGRWSAHGRQADGLDLQVARRAPDIAFFFAGPGRKAGLVRGIDHAERAVRKFETVSPDVTPVPAARMKP